MRRLNRRRRKLNIRRRRLKRRNLLKKKNEEVKGNDNARGKIIALYNPRRYESIKQNDKDKISDAISYIEGVEADLMKRNNIKKRKYLTIPQLEELDAQWNKKVDNKKYWSPYRGDLLRKKISKLSLENMDINFKMNIGKASRSEKNQYTQNIWKISDLEKELASMGETKTPTELQSVKIGNFRKAMYDEKIDQITKDTTYRGY